MDWRSAAKAFKPSKRRGAEAMLYIARAYRAVLTEDGSSAEQRQVMLADFANYCGFYKTCDDPERLAEHNGMRKAFERIFHFLNFGEAEFAALEQAARAEDGADKTEGQF